MAWACSTCTFVNAREDFLACEVCNAPRASDLGNAAAATGDAAAGTGGVAAATGGDAASDTGDATERDVAPSRDDDGNGDAGEKEEEATASSWSFPAYSHPGPPPRVANWEDVLKHPDASLLFASSPSTQLLYDGYPKARAHLLALPRSGALRSVRSVADLDASHLGELRDLHAYARAAARHVAAAKDCERGLRLGYHTRPSLEPLHLHIISADLDSPCLKTKKHFQSFASDFFLEADDLERLLERNDATARRADLDRRAAAAVSLCCHRCGRASRHMPQLKEHIGACAAPFPTNWRLVHASSSKRALADAGKTAAPAPKRPHTTTS